MRPVLTLVFTSALLSACGGDATSPLELSELGELLFFDHGLSRTGSQACASCHDPEAGFVDARPDAMGRTRAVSLGDDGVSVGDRNAPTVAYATFSPAFHVGVRERHNKHNARRRYEGPLGGQFHDGRAADLAEQAGGPFLNPVEMAMPDEAAVVARLEADPTYVEGLKTHFGPEVFERPARAYRAMTEAIAAYEASPAVSPFDAPYDKALSGEVPLGFMALTGRALFFSEFTSCAACHQLNESGDPSGRKTETFSGYEYHNIGLSAGASGPDQGLGAVHPGPGSDGAFKTPTLRNIAVTGPYMHDGRFRDLRTVLAFYDHRFDTERRPLNPETGEPWGAPAFPDSVAPELKLGRALDDDELDALECFLRALTDARYLHLLPDDGLCD